MRHKIVVVGAGGTGKTTLIRSLGEGEFYDKTTMTIMGQAHVLKLFNESNEVFMEFQIFDIAGQEEFFDKNRYLDLAADVSAAIVCFDLGDLSSLEEIEKWVSILPSKSPKILVGTKKDLVSEQDAKQILDEDIKDYINHFGFDEVYSSSAKIQESLEVILDALVNLVI